ncbi:D-lactate dehydrogenase [Ophiocordyceps sinensis CO18]|uniref:D-lactate dehydrogenase n=1 Tax=Ophiocordyceps sinensis (strain Co18 / CGMCC 3.14243) TaxID=911162 RepID=T5AG24_OPHSC|nr:D-lactate dehydrogenase [Ophiocordyceps sinensis CO18]
MAQTQLRATALRSLRASAAAAPAAVAAPATVRCYATEIAPGKPKTLRRGNETRPGGSFSGQVFGSIGARLKREREQREQYEYWREMTDPTWLWSTTFVFLSGVSIAYWLGTYWPRQPEPSSTLPLSKTLKPRHNTKLENMRAAWTDFIKIVGLNNVSTLETDMEQHSSSAWSTHRPAPDEKPFCVVYPVSTDEVSQVIKICHARRIPVVGYSGGTSLEGHYAQTRKGVSINFARMNKVLALHKEDLDVIVQPGVGWESLNDDLAKEGLFFPPDPGPGAMIGGMVGTGCSGTNAYRYGTMREWVLGLTVVLADGTIIKTRQRPRKSSAGYDLTKLFIGSEGDLPKLFIGSEGTLGLVTEATLKVTVKPPATNVAVCTFPSVHHAATCVAKVVGQGVPIAAVEILDDNQMKYINAAGMTSRSWAEAPTLFFKFGGTPAGVKEQVAQVQALARQAGSKTFEFAKNQDEQDELWSARKEALWSVMAMGREGDSVWTGDVAVPMSKLPTLVEETKEDMKKSGLIGSIVGHVGDGNFHTIMMYSEAQRSKAELVVHRMVKRAIEMEGTVSGEHGVGLVKRDYLPHELGESTVAAMRQVWTLGDRVSLPTPRYTIGAAY